MNLAPPLIFGAAAAAQQANTNNEAGLSIAPNLGRSTASMSSVSSNASDIAANANPIAAAQKVQLLQQQAVVAQQVQFFNRIDKKLKTQFSTNAMKFIVKYSNRRRIIKNVHAHESLTSN